ncbi:hypothetical protein [Streptococcus suis]|uniref:hypothetical protein n=1 Tax=Streptococcus suis TaxID=1307 RepID=UPI00041280B4|nr:hypothetical protein [Streptococcus suis]MBY4965660.1 hypothetical protein [Streptococcus suis]MCK4043627.1 hypothetical protein [Streptococcus suis]MDW8778442.1 hypothetical protein [Streptococcus suis]HEL2734683.1 hypothetical protein [Streptococcus suis]HEM2746173.1 hypothetical protein [Streptococcus suis]
MKSSPRKMVLDEIRKTMNCSKAQAEKYLSELEDAGLVRFDLPGVGFGIMELSA